MKSTLYFASLFLFPLLLLLAGVHALLNAPDLGLTFTQAEGRYIIENVSKRHPLHVKEALESQQITTIEGTPLTPFSLISDHDRIVSYEALRDYAAFQERMSRLTPERPVTLTLSGSKTFELMPLTYDPVQLLQELPLLLAAIVCYIIALVLYLKNPLDIRVRLFAVFMVATATIFISFGLLSLRSISIDPVTTLLLYASNYLAFCYFPVLFLHFFLIFPKPFAFALKWRFIIALYLLPLLVAAVHSSRLVYESQQLLFLLSLIGAVIAVFVNYHRSSAVEKAQIKWIVWGTALFIIIMLLSYVLPVLGILGEYYSYQIPALGFVIVPVTIAFAISRHALMDIDTLIDNTLIYTATIITLLVADLGIIYAINATVSREISGSVASVLALWIMILLYAPLRDIIAKGVKTLLKRNRYDIEKVALSLSRALIPLQHRREVVETCRSMLSNTLHPVSTKVITAETDTPDFSRAALDAMGLIRPSYLYTLDIPSLPRAFQDGVAIPVNTATMCSGYILLGNKSNGRLYERRDLDLMEMVANQAAVGIESVTAKERSKANNDRMIREIHDGIGGLATNIGLIAQIASRSDIAETLQKNIASIGRLSEDIVFETRSILQSIDMSNAQSPAQMVSEMKRYCATMLEPHHIAYTLHPSIAPESPVPAPLVVLTLFRITREALSNIVKYAECDAVTITFCLNAHALSLDIADNGRGFSEPVSGRGIGNMRRRAEEVGGTFHIASERSGTHLHLEVPL